MPLALILPRGNQLYLLRKPLIERDKGDTLSECMYVCMFIKCMDGWSLHTARVRINRFRLPILHVVSSMRKINISLFAFAPENLASRNGFGSPVPRHPAHLHTQVESDAYSRDSYRFPRQRPCIHHVIRHQVSPEYIRSHNYMQLRIDSVHYRECAGTGPVVVVLKK